MKKKIGISFTEMNFKRYWNWFDQEDLQNDVELVELSFEKNNTEDIYTCDGFILTGGVDVHPEFYSGSMEYDNKPDEFLQRRDKFEEKIYKYSQAGIKPLLGICRGLQLVNVLQGGKLIQDLELRGNEKHRREADTDKQHAIRIESGSLLYGITHARVCNVNSAHHQVADPGALGDNLMANAYDFDEKIIEGLEFKDKKNKAYMLCVQWHPERMDDQESVMSKNIKESFLEAVKNSI
ncbi:gamma-glutamyl-gamma-aminobutyrate hydrolase family protein [Segetibacter koreensis]|uniref:gamma-glutamyl-gamma-aminobutyrate hydrolase family protein n=1 Tax=Segetibacter koreensis TaxID=398037 RepID=UPI0003714467|nr:gamma-glutamyl-gamma-aminobutyrate hydrolase family protein [Segetibacter koreensis]